MSVPMSQYEALLEEVRCLRRRTEHVQQLADTDPLDLSRSDLGARGGKKGTSSPPNSRNVTKQSFENPRMNSLGVDLLLQTKPPDDFDQIDAEACSEEDECRRVPSAQMSVSSEPISQKTRGMVSLYHGTWPVERTTMWNSEPTNIGPANTNMAIRMDQTSVMSFASSSGGAPLDRVLGTPDHSRRSSQQLEAKMDMVYSLLAMLGGQEHADMGETLLALSTSPESCLAMRQSGCIPLLVQLVQSDKDADTRNKALQALHNLVHSQPDEKLRKRETRVLKLLEQARIYTEALRNNTEYVPEGSMTSEGGDKHPVLTIAHLMKLSFDEGHRQAICQLGGIYITANLVETEHSIHGSTTEDTQCVLMRRYACMALTNLTFGDSGNKALLCSFREFMRALVVQLQSPSDELRQVTASVLRNLSWRADSVSKEILREVGTVTGLMKAAMLNSKENTLKSILSALWNLSAHCTDNKAEICAIEGALGFLVDMLTYKTPSKSLAVIENSGGILRNISSQIAVRDDYREILRLHNCLQVLLDQLKSPSLTIVSNACGTLWNLSAKNAQDQETLWQMGAPAMLRSLNHSKHKMIAMGSSAALKNLLSSRPSHALFPQMDSTAKAMDLPVLPTLGVRKQKALLQDLDQNLHETYDNLESPTKSQDDFKKKSFVKIELKKPKNRSKDVDFCQSFASMTLNEPTTSYFQIPAGQNYGSSSLPYVSQKAFIPVRNNYSDFDDDTDSNDQPIDYSRKYSETKTVQEKPPKKFSYGMYAETDLDQPTDYSLRYAEDDSDSDGPDEKSEFIQDTVKTYCTEGTPYETPINFSTATSMSDLRIENNEKVIDNDTNRQKKGENASHLDEKDHCSIEDISEIEVRKSEKVLKSQFSSGMMSPDKPINYCEEGTPGCFSRVSSFGSLNSIPANENLKVKEIKDEVPDVTDAILKSDDSPNEGAKAVKFEQTVNYAEETPLMFSRSSSLASLDSVEQHSIHDDRSSVVSDFSRLTSGLISPSDIPDSPSQTVPPSPRPRKGPPEYPTTSRTPFFQRTAGDGRPQPAPRTIQKPSIFDDNITKFKEESTPVQFSTATSLSSLMIDDVDEPQAINIEVPATSNEDNQSARSSTPNVRESPHPVNDEKQDVDQEKCVNISSDSTDELHLSEHEEDDDILADCINIGMQIRRRHNSEDDASPLKTPSKFSPKARPSTSSIPLPRSSIPTRSTPSTSRISAIRTPKELPCDTMTMYCTEDTPGISHAGSISDLSALSMTNDSKSKKDYLSDDSSNLSADNENILAECIQSAMPKAKPTGTPSKQSPVGKAGIAVDGVPPKDRRLNYLSSKDEVEKFAVENSPCQYSLRSSLSDLTVDGSVAGLATLSPQTTGPSTSQTNPTLKTKYREHRTLSREDSLSSLSVDSVGSADNDEALLEQCISSGMPKSKSNHQYRDKTKHPNVNSDTNQTHTDPKNASAASAVLRIPPPRPRGDRPEPTAQRADVDANSVIDPKATWSATTTGEHRDVSSLAKSSPITEISSTEQKRNGFNETATNKNDASYKANIVKPKNFDDLSPEKSFSNSDNLAQNHESDSDKEIEKISNRMLDPDAMIESLDRFTAELVLQAQSHLEHKDDKFQTSTTDGDTWNDISPNDLSFPSISGSVPNVITFSDSNEKPRDDIDGKNEEFSSFGTSTMTESTLIAMEANKLASTIKLEAMTYSTASLELDLVQPPSNLNSLANSIHELEIHAKRSPKLTARKKSLPVLMMKKALSNSLNQASSIESLENNSISNLEHMNPPSLMGDIDFIDLESSMTSVASLQSEIADVKTDFLVNGIVSSDRSNINPIFNVKVPYLPSNYSEIENINPPSLFNEITDLCNSLADVPTEAIGSETEIFEECFSQVMDKTDDDMTLFSDANGVTPLQSDLSSSESTPKRKKSLTPKERRRIAKDRYQTYTIDLEGAALDVSETEDYNTCFSETYKSAKLTAREKRILNKSRFETQVVDVATTEALKQLETPGSSTTSNVTSLKSSECVSNVNGNNSNTNSAESSPTQSPRAKLSIRRNFLQKRLENRDRFKTKVIHESETNSETNPNSPELHFLLQKEADAVLRTLSETKSRVDELLDCETLSLVSNEEDSEHNSGGSTNYRTYHKSWGFSSNKIPVIQKSLGSYQSEGNAQDQTSLETTTTTEILNNGLDQEMNSLDMPSLENYESETEEIERCKPKIVKPGEGREEIVQEEQAKAIRGHRKSLYGKSKPITKPVKTSPVRNVKISPVPVNKVNSPLKTIPKAARPPIAQTGSKLIRPSTVHHQPKVITKPTPIVTSPKHKSPVRIQNKPSKPATNSPVLERQGTFVKEESASSKSKSSSGIPKPSQSVSSIPKPSRIAKAISQSGTNVMKTIQKIQTTSIPKSGLKPPQKTMLRSPSADSRDVVKRSSLQPSSSTQSLKNGAVKRSSLPETSQKSSSNSSLTSNASSKQITSKIASLWKRVEESKKQTNKGPDKRIWIQSGNPGFDNKETSVNCDTPKRVSRLGSFVVVEDEGAPVIAGNLNRHSEVTY